MLHRLVMGPVKNWRQENGVCGRRGLPLRFGTAQRQATASAAGNGFLDIGIIKDDVGGFASQLKRNLLWIASGSLQNQLADFGGPGEGHLIELARRYARKGEPLFV